MDIGQVWRDVIHAYVRAYCDDHRKRIADNVAGWEAKFLAAHAVESLRQEYSIAAMARLDRIGDPGPKEDIAIVEQSENRIVAEVPARRSSDNAICPIPFFPIRFIVTKAQTGWLIDSVFAACISCNCPPIGPNSPVLPRTPGRCFLCRGKRELIEKVKPRWLWTFRWDQPVPIPCIACDGKGTCPRCSSEIAPGWNRIVSLDHMRPVTSVSTQRSQ